MAAHALSVDPADLSSYAPAAMPDEMLSLARVAELLNVNERTVRREVERGKLYAVRVGELYRVPRLAFLAYVRGQQFDPATYDPLAIDTPGAPGQKADEPTE